MNHQTSAEDQAFRSRFEACKISPIDFDHRAHVRLAYIYLCENDPDTVAQKMRQSLQKFLVCSGVDASKYHETMTRAWIMAVYHFKARSPESVSAATFIEKNPKLLDLQIMLTHYSENALFSEVARSIFVEPDLEPIPNS